MKFGVREICDVVFKSLQNGKIGGMEVQKGQPVLYIDSAKTSTIEGAASTVYATGGRGNTRLLAWEGEKTLTFTVEDALLSPIGFAILSGAGLFNLKDTDETNKIRVHCIEEVFPGADGSFTLGKDAQLDSPIFAFDDNGKKIVLTNAGGDSSASKAFKATGATGRIYVDYYTGTKAAVTEMQIDAENFGGFYYVEASTLFRRESDGKDLPAEIVFPKVKVQSNFTFSMASTGDPSTFTFTMDAFPGYTMFEQTKKVLCAMQVIDETAAEVDEGTPVTTIEEGEKAQMDGDNVGGIQ
jgi:hypothetical protein